MITWRSTTTWFTAAVLSGAAISGSPSRAVTHRSLRRDHGIGPGRNDDEFSGSACGSPRMHVSAQLHEITALESSRQYDALEGLGGAGLDRQASSEED